MSKPLPLVDIVIFGGHGDLALRKIMPALYYLFSEKHINPHSRVISTTHNPFDHDQHLQLVKTNLNENLENEYFSEEHWLSFSSQLSCIVMDITQADDYKPLTESLNQFPDRDRVNYLSTPSSLFGDICTSLQESKLITKNSRVVLEKPIGHDLDSFKKLDDHVTAVFDECSIFRIDHYLGKDTVQNILALRFSNALFMPLWNNQCIDHIQITVSEEVGTG